MRVLHAIHDFLPRHQAGSEVYALELCRELSAAHDVTVLCAEYDPSRRHGHVTWRVHEGLPIVELVNNWVCDSFEETYRPALLGRRIADILRAVQPDVIHVHNLLNLSFDLPSLACAHGVPVVATLHDYTLVCPSGGQRIHRAEQHVCREIDPERCARCFPESPFHAQISFGRLAACAPGLMTRAALGVSRRLPALAGRLRRAVRHATPLAVTRRDIDDRLAAARRIFDQVDVFVAPSQALADDFVELGIATSRIRVSDYGFVPLQRSGGRVNGGQVSDGVQTETCPPAMQAETRPPLPPLRIGYVGTIVWHKGVHVLLEAVRQLPAADYVVRIFGDLNVFPEYVADLRRRAAGLPVTFMGAFDRERVADAYAEIDVLVVPSLWLENSPLVIHEARMAGVAVVGARIGGIPDLIDHGRTGLLYDASSATELARALQRLIADRDLADRLARTAPPVKSIAQDAREWEAVYHDVHRRRAGNGPPQSGPHEVQ